MIAKKRVILLLSLLLVLSGCVFKEDETNIVLPVLALGELDEQVLTQANFRQEYTEVDEPIIGTKTNKIEYTESGQGIPWLVKKVSDSKEARRQYTQLDTYNQFDELISSTVIPSSEKLIEPTPNIYEYGQPLEVGVEYAPRRVTRYGYDCGGCSVTAEDFSGSASGVKFGNNRVRQFDGTWQEGITYGGLYVLATSPSIPFCTVVEISNHPFNGGGLTKGVPFQAIVLNRGVSGSDIDLFIGSESQRVVTQAGSTIGTGTKIKVIGSKQYVRNQGCR